MLSTTKLSLRSSVLAFVVLALGVSPVLAKEFVFDEKANKEVAKKLAIPVYFALPDSARIELPKTIETPDRLIDFRHPDAIRTGSNVGLRLIVAKRAGLAKRLAQSGLVQTGDLLLTFRSEWGGVGAYPNVQMGISHAGLAYLKDGLVRNLDNPLTEEYLGAGMRADLTSEHYRTLRLIHIVRPRNLTGADRANIAAWATRFNSGAKRIYPSQLSFNQDYNDPKYKPGRPLQFVKQVGQMGLGQSNAGKVDMFCSEFAWSVLALRGCDPAKTANDFKGSGIPSCIKPIMSPMRATGTRKGRSGYSGLGDGPLMVIESLKLPDAEREKLVQSIFVANPAGFKKMSVGHRDLAQSMQPKFAKLETYYRSSANGSWLGLKGRVLGTAINTAIPSNYSPTSFLINTLLPPDNKNRTMDYVATVLIE